ncbi:MAG: LysM peptidoglycan-binding domain-containing protein [Mycobacteriales bacterium]
MTCCGTVAAALLPHPITAWQHLGQLSAHSTADGAATNDLTLAASSLTVWALIIWFSTNLLMLAATQVPGRVGAAARAASSLVIPAIVRRVACSALSISLAGGILAGTAQAAGLSDSEPASRAPSNSQQTAPLDLDWPQPNGQAGENDPDPKLGPHDDGTADGAVTVQRGDSLWKLAAQSLGPHASDRAIATTWPTWWERNREVIGENPHLIHPGQQLQPPAHEPN